MATRFGNLPSANQMLTGSVPVTGQVFAQDFNRYQLEYAPAGTPDQFTLIGNFSTTQHPNAGDVLAQWDTFTVPNGSYTVRLTMYSNVNGGYVQQTVPVTVNNIAPTPTQALPTNVPLPPTLPSEFTPIPFDQPTPTATINPAG